MATLANKNKDVFIELNLHSTKESPKWIGYTLRVFAKKENAPTEILRLKYENSLCFENTIAPEIPILIEELSAVIEGSKSSYLFEPLDEKDFSFEIKQINENYLATLFMDEALIFNTHQWTPHAKIGIQMKIEIDSMSNFINQLKNEFNKLCIWLIAE
jgi:hypothetical protein